MPPIRLLGNDVVDVADPWAVGRARDRRFLGRVLSPAEADWLAGSRRPEEDLWVLWSAKEAAFKAWSRVHPGLVFAPSRFEVDPEAGVVQGAGGVCPVEWDRAPGRVHCLACVAPEGPRPNVAWKAEPMDPVWPEPRDPDGPPSPESRCARALAGRLLAEAGFGGAVLRREERGAHRPGPPLVLVEGQVLENVQVSLSHDGAWVAAAVAWW